MISRTVAGIVFLLLAIQNTQALTWVENPTDSWIYYRVPTGRGGFGPADYFPTDISELRLGSAWREGAGDTFFVQYTDPDNGAFSVSSATKGFHLFETWIVSDFDQELLFVNNGNDGHALFMDHNFVLGGGSGVEINDTISLQAGVPCNLFLAAHNTNGGFNTLLLAGGQPIERVSGITMSAVLTHIPEPQTCLLALFSICMMLGVRYQKH